MAIIRHVIKHGLEHEDARQVARKATASYLEAHSKNVKGKWVKPTVFKFRVKAAKSIMPGTITVESEVIRFSISNVPGMYMLFAKSGIEKLEAEVNFWLGEFKKGKLS